MFGVQTWYEYDVTLGYDSGPVTDCKCSSYEFDKQGYFGIPEWSLIKFISLVI
jgi:hypothetical protein